MSAVEIVSPVLTGLEGLQDVRETLRQLGSIHARANRSCGFHVHVGLDSLLGDKTQDGACVADWVRRLINTVSQYESALFGITGSPSRLYNQYCHSIKMPWAGRLKSGDPLMKVEDETRMKSRYHSVNLCNLFAEKGTIEFRVFAGTLNETKATGHVVTALALCQKATESPLAPKFNGLMTPADYPGAVRKMQSVLWNNGKRKGWPKGAWKLYGKDVIKNQRWNASRLQSLVRVGHA